MSSRFIGAEHEPFGLDQATAQGGRGLLILAGKVVLANRATDVLQNGERLARRMQGLAQTASEALRSPDRLDRVHLVGFGDRRKLRTSHGS